MLTALTRDPHQTKKLEPREPRPTPALFLFFLVNFIILPLQQLRLAGTYSLKRVKPFSNVTELPSALIPGSKFGLKFFYDNGGSAEKNRETVGIS